tara:strand:- start:1017 stop:1625 length:609 start_codon:yes stop_codon:yes gene_type:complete
MAERTIAWEKWEELPISEPVNPNSFMGVEAEEGEESTEFDLSDFFDRMPKLVHTPVGMYQVDDRMNPIRQFDCWLGHTNFDITDSIKNKIESIAGVEVLVILTRYRFFIGVGKLFSFRDVRVNIENSTCGKTSEQREAEEYREFVKEELSMYEHWAIFIFPNGEMAHIGTNDLNDEDWKETVLLYKNAKMLSGGTLMQSKES